MDKTKVEKLSALYEKLDRVNKMISRKSPTWTFSVGVSSEDGNEFDFYDIAPAYAKNVLDNEAHALIAEIEQLGGTV